MKNWITYLILFIVGFTAAGFGTAGESRSLPNTMSSETVICAFSTVPNSTDILGEQASSLQVPAPSQISIPANAKDFYSSLDNPPAENHRIERQILAYIFFTQTFPASESLSQLRRLNI